MSTGVETQNILTDVQERIATYSAASGIPVSLQAQELIAGVLGGFLFDPHPSWSADRTVHTEYFNAHMAKLPAYLAEIGARVPSGQPITTFDVLNWLASNLGSICDYICPFPSGNA